MSGHLVVVGAVAFPANARTWCCGMAAAGTAAEKRAAEAASRLVAGRATPVGRAARTAAERRLLLERMGGDETAVVVDGGRGVPLSGPAPRRGCAKPARCRRADIDDVHHTRPNEGKENTMGETKKIQSDTNQMIVI